ncbi:hypothetical protein SL053_002405, partial [Flavobacterium psychrophilum]|nr:hypothetical protein [Flavobacterium psychrophilum]
YPSAPAQNANENQEPPQGWPRQPVFNAPNDVPGPPVQFGPPITPTDVKAGEGFVGNGLPEKDVFYYHPDHLGSSSYISTLNGQISQHVEYIAFGEVLFEEHSSSFKSPYLFNGKELDRETNLSFYGARYLDMKTSLWLSIDPLAEEFPEYSPYSFCFNNPLRFTDPDGMAPTDIVILGANKSSVTIKTDLIDVSVNASSLGIDFGGNYTLSGGDIVQAAVDIAGVFDPTPASDILGAKLSADSGDWWGAGASVLGAALPYAGDLAKEPKIAKGLDKISDAIDTAKKGLKIDVGDASKIERKLLDPPSKHGNAPTFKKDGSSVEIHHEGQNPNGPFKEMHKNDHRGKGNDAVNHPNKNKPSQVDRKEFNKARTQYWKEQYPKQ